MKVELPGEKKTEENKQEVVSIPDDEEEIKIVLE